MPHVPRKDQISVLDGLRAVAVLLVLWEHLPWGSLPPWIDGARQFVRPGGLGVDLFFVLSGFLITRILLWERAARAPLWPFLMRRAARIFPIYYLTLLAVALWRPGPELPWCATYTANYRWIGHELGTPLAHVWSLCVEEHFYLLWPLLLYALGSARARTWLVYAVLPLVVLAGVWACQDDDPERAQRAMQYSTHLRVLSLGTGALLAYHEQRLRALRWVGSWKGLLLFFLVVLQILVDASFGSLLEALEPRSRPWVLLSAWLLQWAMALSIFLLALGSDGSRGLVARLLSSAPLRGVGRISYALYLYHYPVYWAFGVLREGPGPALPAERVLGALAVTFVLASLSYFVLERPILRWAGRFRPQAAAC